MPVSDMSALTLRAMFIHKLFLKPTTLKSLSKPPSLTSLQSLQNPNFSRHFHSTTLLHRSEEPSFAPDSPKAENNSTSNVNTRRVWSVFGPERHIPVTPRVENKSRDGEEPRNEIETQVSLSSLRNGVKKFEQNDDLSVNNETQVGLSSFENVVEKFEKNEADLSVESDQNQMGLSSLGNKTRRSDHKANSGGGYFSEIGRIKSKKGKLKTSWVCSSCGDTFGQWWGACRSCHASGTVKQFSERVDDVVGGGGVKISGFGVSEKALRSWMPAKDNEAGPMRLKDVNRSGVQHRRIPLPGVFGSEVERVLGGGVVRGSLVLVGGDPGVGKSTLVLQMASLIAKGHELGEVASVLYVSGEESVQQIGIRADRMEIETEDLFLYSSTDIEDILEKIQSLNPQALIIDSIQTVYLKGVSGSAGGVLQVKECTQYLLRFAKKTNVPVILIGHVTKSGDIAGPRVLEHIVDVVLYMEGEKNSSHRLLRTVKNRFGSTDELGVFKMSQSGLEAVLNPSGMFLSEQYADSEYLAGLAVAVIMDGSRTFLIEIQALCVGESTVSRQFNGVRRADMIVSVLSKQAGLKLQDNTIFVNIVSGVALKGTAGDLAIAAAICSSFLEFPIPNSTAFIGEIGLGGELRPVPQMNKRIHTVAKLGYKTCIVPKSASAAQGTPGFEDIRIIGCKDLKQVISNVFKRC